MELTEIISSSAVFVSGLSVIVNACILVYTQRVRAQVDRNLKMMDPWVHAEKWIIDEKAKALKEYWASVNFLANFFTSVNLGLDDPTLIKMFNESLLRMHHAYLNLRIHYNDFGDMHDSYYKAVFSYVGEAKPLYQDEHAKDAQFDELLKKYPIDALQKDILTLVQAKLGELSRSIEGFQIGGL